MTKRGPETIKSFVVSCAAQSHHPASRALYEFFQAQQVPNVHLDVFEEIGQGLRFEYENDSYFLGRTQAAFDDQSQRGYEVIFDKNNEPIATFMLQEVLQDHMGEVINWLDQQQKKIWLISGDQQSRVHHLAAQLRIPSEQAFGNCSPEDKRDKLRAIDGQTLYIGDGLNDQLALQTAHVSALSLHSRLQLSQQAHLYFLSESMTWLPITLHMATTLQRVIAANLRFLVIYNVLVISLALLGLINPLISAIIMPISSLWVIGFTTHRIQKADVHHIKL